MTDSHTPPTCPDCGSPVVMRDDKKSGNPMIRYACDAPMYSCHEIENLRVEVEQLRESGLHWMKVSQQRENVIAELRAENERLRELLNKATLALMLIAPAAVARPQIDDKPAHIWAANVRTQERLKYPASAAPQVCMESFGFKMCVLDAGHDGLHKSQSGTVWSAIEGGEHNG